MRLSLRLAEINYFFIENRNLPLLKVYNIHMAIFPLLASGFELESGSFRRRRIRIRRRGCHRTRQGKATRGRAGRTGGSRLGCGRCRPPQQLRLLLHTATATATATGAILLLAPVLLRNLLRHDPLDQNHNGTRAPLDQHVSRSAHLPAVQQHVHAAGRARQYLDEGRREREVTQDETPAIQYGFVHVERLHGEDGETCDLVDVRVDGGSVAVLLGFASVVRNHQINQRKQSTKLHRLHIRMQHHGIRHGIHPPQLQQTALQRRVQRGVDHGPASHGLEVSIGGESAEGIEHDAHAVLLPAGLVGRVGEGGLIRWMLHLMMLLLLLRIGLVLVVAIDGVDAALDTHVRRMMMMIVMMTMVMVIMMMTMFLVINAPDPLGTLARHPRRGLAAGRFGGRAPRGRVDHALVGTQRSQ